LLPVLVVALAQIPFAGAVVGSIDSLSIGTALVGSTTVCQIGSEDEELAWPKVRVSLSIELFTILRTSFKLDWSPRLRLNPRRFYAVGRLVDGDVHLMTPINDLESSILKVRGIDT
jgi:hypothetical protein